MDDLETQRRIAQYMRGACHVHAVAAMRLHGGALAVAYDHSEPQWADNGITSAVIHVWSVHQTPDGPVARDVTGDIPYTRETMIAHLEDFFPSVIGKFDHGDAWIDMQATQQEIVDLSGDGDHQPLCGLTEADIEEALALDSVRMAPGARRLDEADRGPGPGPA